MLRSRLMWYDVMRRAAIALQTETLSKAVFTDVLSIANSESATKCQQVLRSALVAMSEHRINPAQCRTIVDAVTVLDQECCNVIELQLERLRGGKIDEVEFSISLSAFEEEAAGLRLKESSVISRSTSYDCSDAAEKRTDATTSPTKPDDQAQPVETANEPSINDTPPNAAEPRHSPPSSHPVEEASGHSNSPSPSQIDPEIRKLPPHLRCTISKLPQDLRCLAIRDFESKKLSRETPAAVRTQGPPATQQQPPKRTRHKKRNDTRARPSDRSSQSPKGVPKSSVDVPVTVQTETPLPARHQPPESKGHCKRNDKQATTSEHSSRNPKAVPRPSGNVPAAMPTKARRRRRSGSPKGRLQRMGNGSQAVVAQQSEAVAQLAEYLRLEKESEAQAAQAKSATTNTTAPSCDDNHANDIPPTSKPTDKHPTIETAGLNNICPYVGPHEYQCVCDKLKVCQDLSCGGCENVTKAPCPKFLEGGCQDGDRCLQGSHNELWLVLYSFTRCVEHRMELLTSGKFSGAN